MTAVHAPRSGLFDGHALAGKLLLPPIICTAIMVIEGIDNNIISYVGPLIRDEFRISQVVLGTIYSVTVFASLIGGLVLAPLSDVIGRRPVLIVSSLIMALCSLSMPLVSNAYAMVAVRFVVGVAFGAAVPTCFALTADYAPQRWRAFLIAVVTAGVALGYVFAGMLSAALIESIGWRALLNLVGLASLGWVVVLFAMLPENPLWLLQNRPKSRAVDHLRLRLGDGFSGDDPAIKAQPGARPADLLRGPMRWLALITWTILSCVYAVELVIGFWLPTMLIASGYKVGEAAAITGTGKIASIVGSVAVGLAMDRFGMVRILGGTFLACAAALVGLGFSTGSYPALMGLVLISFFLLDGSFAGTQALTASAFPGQLRGTAMGWIGGLARVIGGGLGTMAGGALIGAHVGMGGLTAILAMVMVLGGVCLFASSSLRRLTCA